jgi:hypothetical protein
MAVAYEAGPTGFGLARELAAAGVRCVVAAPLKLQRPAADRIKTDARDALHLARLLRMDQLVEVRVPSIEQEAARDLVRAREDVRGDLMRCRRDTQIDAYQPAQRISSLKTSSSLRRSSRRQHHQPWSQGGEPDNGSHSCAATGPDLGGSAHFPHSGHPWPGQRRRSVGRGSPSDPHSSPPTGPSRDAHVTPGPLGRSSTGVPLHAPRWRAPSRSGSRQICRSRHPC